MGIGVSVENSVESLLTDFVTSRSAALCTDLVPIAITGATIHLMLIELAIIRGETGEPVQTIVWKSLRITVIAGLALSLGMYQSIIMGGAAGIEEALIRSMAGSKSVGELVDKMAQPFLDLGNQLWNKAVVGFWPNFGLVVAAGSVSIAQFFIISIGLGFYLLAKVALALVLAIGPVFILCAMWPATEKYTESWLGQVLNYILLKILVATSMGMILTFVSQYARHIEMTQDAVNVIRATTSLL
jgi:type IV secretion system protein VirB6